MSKQTNRFRPAFDLLETRTVMASSLQAYTSGGYLYVLGTDASDYIKVTQSSGRLAVSGANITTNGTTTSSIDANSVSKVAVYGYGGNDTVDCTGLTKDAVIYGGDGNDQLYGGAGADYIDGGSGTNTEYGMSGNDYLIGTNADTLYGNDGFDYYYRPINPSAPVVNGLKVTDVQQGMSPTCQTAASLAETVKEGYNIAQDIKYLGNSNYQIKLHGNSSTQTVSYNGWSNDNDLAPVNGEYWPLLMQRARFQALGINNNNSYTASQWDSLNAKTGSRLYSTADAMYTFTGNPGYYYDISRASPQNLQTALAQGDFIVASSYSGTGHSATGIIGNHAYAVMDVYNDGGTWKVRLYNPWGSDRGDGVTMDNNRAAKNDGYITLTWAQFTSASNFRGYTQAHATAAQAAVSRSTRASRE